MRSVRYNVAASLDGFIAGPEGECDWIPHDPAVDFAAIFARVDTVLIGRRSYETAMQMGGLPWGPGMRVYVFSRTLPASAVPGATVVAEGAVELVSALRAEPGDGDIWLFGGGNLCRGLLTAGLVDRIEVTLVPVLLGAGTPLFPLGYPRMSLQLVGTRTYPTGMVTLSYDVALSQGATGQANGPA